MQGASGSGKTIILIHRALRLAAENSTSPIRIFTINRTLADLIRSSIAAINRTVPANIHVAAFYDFLLDCVLLFEPREAATASWTIFPANGITCAVLQA